MRCGVEFFRHRLSSYKSVLRVEIVFVKSLFIFNKKLNHNVIRCGRNMRFLILKINIFRLIINILPPVYLFSITLKIKNVVFPKFV